MANLMEMTNEEAADHLRITAVAQQNDAFRRYPTNDDTIGRWVATRSVHAMGTEFVAAAIQAVCVFPESGFTEDVDPHGDHSFGAVEVQGRKIWWKIDLFDAAYEYGSEDPANVEQTRRVLTIMFPEDY